MQVKVKVHPGGRMPERHGECFDLATTKDEKLRAGEVRVIGLGVSIELPDGVHGIVAARSSTALKWDIIPANGIGIIENDYNGDGDVWGFVAYALRDTEIPAGTRIAQFRTMCQMPDADLVQVDALGHDDRGGYGSTGQAAKR